MATNQTNDGRRRYSEQDADRSAESRKTAQQYEARKKKKFIIFGVEIVLLAAMVGVLFFIFNTGGEGPNIATLPSDLDSLGIASEIQQQMGNNNKPSSSNSSSGSVSSDENAGVLEYRSVWTGSDLRFPAYQGRTQRQYYDSQR